MLKYINLQTRHKAALYVRYAEVFMKKEIKSLTDMVLYVILWYIGGYILGYFLIYFLYWMGVL